MYVKAECGCEIDLWVISTSWGSGCCCGNCYDSYGDEYDVNDVTIEKACDQHRGPEALRQTDT